MLGLRFLAGSNTLGPRTAHTPPRYGTALTGPILSRHYHARHSATPRGPTRSAEHYRDAVKQHNLSVVALGVGQSPYAKTLDQSAETRQGLLVGLKPSIAASATVRLLWGSSRNENRSIVVPICRKDGRLFFRAATVYSSRSCPAEIVQKPPRSTPSQDDARMKLPSSSMSKTAARYFAIKM